MTRLALTLLAAPPVRLLARAEVYKTVRQVALKALKGRFSQQRFREFKHEAEILQLVQGSSVSAHARMLELSCVLLRRLALAAVLRGL